MAINIDDYKAKLQGLKTRADALTAKKASLEKEVTVQEEAQKRAIQELVDLGFPEVKDMSPDELQAFGEKLTGELATAMGELETQVVSTEKLLGVYQGLEL